MTDTANTATTPETVEPTVEASTVEEPSVEAAPEAAVEAEAQPEPSVEVLPADEPTAESEMLASHNANLAKWLAEGTE